ncbi:MAG: carbohydrate ABC transporter permease, partial [Atribacterota bacterium]
IVTTSFKLGSEIFDYTFFFKPILNNYRSVLSEASFQRYYLNSLLVAVFSTLIAMILGFGVSYGFSRFAIQKKDSLLFFILSMRMIPPIVVAIPFFLMFRKIGLYDSLLGLVLIYVAFNLPFVIWVLRGFIDEVPVELEEAAMIDGCSRLKLLRHVTVPISFTGIMATAVLCFIFVWNEFFFALILTGVNRRTVTVGVYNFIGFAQISWGQMCAASLLVSIPIIIFGILVRKNLVSGLTFGALKE